MKGNFWEIFVITLFLGTVPAWFTHVIYCFSEERWGFLIAGAILVPVAIIHGFYLWIIWLAQLISSIF